MRESARSGSLGQRTSVLVVSKEDGSETIEHVKTEDTETLIEANALTALSAQPRVVDGLTLSIASRQPLFLPLCWLVYKHVSATSYADPVRRRVRELRDPPDQPRGRSPPHSLLIRQKAVQLAYDKFAVPKDQVVRLSCKATEMPWVGGYAAGEDVFLYAQDGVGR